MRCLSRSLACPILALPLAALFVCASCNSVPDPLPGFPRLVLWAWERPENLSYIVPSATGVAYLAETLTLGNGTLQRYPRRQPLYLPPHTPLIAVARIESTGPEPPAAGEVAAELAHVASEASGREPIHALQIDFDARAPEHNYYRALLADLRPRLPRAIALQITALVSWCEGDDWLRGLPIASAVPMFFRMGVDPHSTREHLREPLCRSSLGIATDEFYVTIPRVRRVFVFSHQLWTESSYRAVLQASKKWFSIW